MGFGIAINPKCLDRREEVEVKFQVLNELLHHVERAVNLQKKVPKKHDINSKFTN